MAKERVYKKGLPGSEYDAYQGKPEQIKNRASRNAAHRMMKPAKGMEVDHRDGDPRNNSRKNLQVISRTANRRKGG